jgi:hypothetical protein
MNKADFSIPGDTGPTQQLLAEFWTPADLPPY